MGILENCFSSFRVYVYDIRSKWAQCSNIYMRYDFVVPLCGTSVDVDHLYGGLPPYPSVSSACAGIAHAIDNNVVATTRPHGLPEYEVLNIVNRKGAISSGKDLLK